MRKILFYVLFSLIGTMQLIAESATVIVKDTSVVSVIYNSERGRGRRIYTPEKRDGKAIFTIPASECKDLIYLICGEASSWVVVEPNKQIEVKPNGETLKFYGDLKKENGYLQKWTNEYFHAMKNPLASYVCQMFRQLPSNKRGFISLEEMNDPSYQNWMYNFKINAFTQLDKAKLKNECFVNQQKDRIYYSWVELCLTSYIRTLGTGELSQKQKDLIKSISFESEYSSRYPGKDNLLRSYLDLMIKSNPIVYNSSEYLTHFAEKIKNQAVRDEIILKELEGQLQGGLTYKLANVANNVRQIASESIKGRIDSIIEQVGIKQQKEKVGEALKYFSSNSPNGKSITVDQFKGKYVLLDLWATWCIPCKYQIPHLMKLEKELEERDIVFLSLSVDRAKQIPEWKKTIEQYEMHGYTSIINEEHKQPFMDHYGIRGIPRFMLIDPSGDVVIEATRRPSDPILKLQLEELLDEYDQRKSTLVGEIKGEPSKISLMDNSSFMIKTIASDAKVSNNPRISFEIEKPGFYYFSVYGYGSYQVWLEPQQHLSFTVDKKGIQFAGEGAGISNMIQELSAKFDKIKPLHRGAPLQYSYSKRLVAQYEQKVEYVNNSTLTDIDKKIMIGYMQGELLSSAYSSLALSKVFGKGFPRPIVGHNYSKDLLELDLISELTLYPKWMDGLEEFVYAHLDNDRVKINGLATRCVDLAAAIEDQDLKDQYICEILKMENIRGHLCGFNERVSSALGKVKDEEIKAQLNEMLVHAEKGKEYYASVDKGTDLSDFTFENREGEIVKLGDYKGEFIFIDLWSTGCNPCIGEMPYIIEMEKKLKGKNLRCISISMDRDEKEWNNYLVKNKMHGIHLKSIKGIKDPFCKAIGLRGIPRFMLLDPNCRVIDYNTLRPSNPALQKEIELIMNAY